MANSGGFIDESIWRDRDFRALPRTAQATFAQLLSQKELDRAGLLPLQPTKWVKGCDAMTLDDLTADLKALEDARFIIVDEETDELLVRSYMRRSNVIKQPNLLKNALKCASMAASDRLRRELAVELRRLGRSDTRAVAEEIDPTTNPENPFETPTDDVPNPNGSLPEPFNPSGTPTEPRGVGEGEGVVTSVGGSVGGSHARTHTRETPEPAQSDDAPPLTCSRHPEGTDRPCGPCKDARQRHDAWVADQNRLAVERAQAERAARVEAERIARENCPLCDNETGYRGNRVCDHDPDTADRAARGMALVREQLAASASKGSSS
ncbi:helix-turn-helix DNA binding protein [Gordonia phage Walrus]|uniref:Helix-turn-helix DNA binding protein n=1 Tax=Gordonia phage Walrus TaxID=2517927 RepID=A0A481S2R2_9CAUD|nr:replication initiation protein [Gordonia phage Walrus]QBG78460.1 helix-turn-helix DNA binding protein [Gordonia phage Walrus]